MVYFPRTNLFGFVTNLEKDRVGIRIMYIDGKESKIYPGDTVHGTTKYLDRELDRKKPDFYLAIVRSMLWQTKDQYATFNDTLNAEYIEWISSSEAERECLRNTYCTKYAIFNAYHAMKYLTSLMPIIYVKFKHELISAVMEDLVKSLISLNSMDECKKPLAILSEIVSEGSEHDRDYLYPGDKERIMGLLKAYLALNRQQLNSLRDCSITDFGIQKRINHEFVAFLELHRLCEDLNNISLGGLFCGDLDEQLGISVYSLLDCIKEDSRLERVESRIKTWTYHDAIRYWHKVIDLDHGIYLDLANLPQTENFKVPLCNIFDPRREYDYMSVY
jgi:hypothetical protein